jgi:hypothetical protein
MSSVFFFIIRNWPGGWGELLYHHYHAISEHLLFFRVLTFYVPCIQLQTFSINMTSKCLAKSMHNILLYKFRILVYHILGLFFVPEEHRKKATFFFVMMQMRETLIYCSWTLLMFLGCI